LNELRRILFVSQIRLEIHLNRKTLGEELTVGTRFWFQVEIHRPFVLLELRHILDIVQNRVEISLTGENSRQK